MTVDEKVEQNYEWYLKNSQNFKVKKNHPWVVINEQKFLAAFETWDEAIAYVTELNLEGGFIIQNLVRDKEPIYLGATGLGL